VQQKNSQIYILKVMDLNLRQAWAILADAFRSICQALKANVGTGEYLDNITAASFQILTI
jgi:hypothetical protein